MKNNKKKGFTLVELLVVIAILAILASVSVVGYLSFTKKADESKVLTEATQIRDVIYGSLADGEEKVGEYTFTYNDSKMEVTGVSGNDLTDAINKVFPDVNGLAISYTLSNEKDKLSIEFESYTAIWTFATGNIEVVENEA